MYNSPAEDHVCAFLYGGQSYHLFDIKLSNESLQTLIVEVLLVGYCVCHSSVFCGNDKNDNNNEH